MLGKSQAGFCMTQRLEDARCDAIGNSFHTIVVARIWSDALYDACQVVTFSECWRRWSALVNVPAPVPTVPQVVSEFQAHRWFNSAKAGDFEAVWTPIPSVWGPAQEAVMAHIRNADLRGIDVRVEPKSVFKAKLWPRHSMDPSQWRWSIIQSYRFFKKQHINELELRAVLNYLRFRAQRKSHHRARLLLFTDSQVCIGLLAKGRSSALRLNHLMRRIAPVLVSCNMRIAVGWVRTDLNPADLPSRQFAHAPA